MRFLSVLGLLAGVCVGCSSPMRVMSFNIRYATDADGVNRWSNRTDLVLATIRASEPDIIGFQEMLAAQADFVQGVLPAYEFVGVGRIDGRREGEMCAVMYRRAAFVLVDHGHTWLSEQPEVIGSRGWDAACERMVTWVKLQTRTTPARTFYVFNTHFDHRGARARLESAKLVRELLTQRNDAPIILTGDFNCAPGSPPYAVLVDEGPLHDSYVLAGVEEEECGTYNGFDGRRGGARIDWILVSDNIEVVAAEIDRRSFERDGRESYPSDHFPVTATVRLP